MRKSHEKNSSVGLRREDQLMTESTRKLRLQERKVRRSRDWKKLVAFTSERSHPVFELLRKISSGRFNSAEVWEHPVSRLEWDIFAGMPYIFFTWPNGRSDFQDELCFHIKNGKIYVFATISLCPNPNAEHVLKGMYYTNYTDSLSFTFQGTLANFETRLLKELNVVNHVSIMQKRKDSEYRLLRKKNKNNLRKWMSI